MKGLSTFIAHLIMIVIILSLFPLIYYSTVNPSKLENTAVVEQYNMLREMGSQKLGFTLLNSTRILVYNYGSHDILVRKIYIDDVPVEYSIKVYLNGSWMVSNVIPSRCLGILSLDIPINKSLVIVGDCRIFRYYI